MEIHAGLLSPGLMIELLGIFLLLLILLPATISDYQTQKIPNGLAMAGWVIGPITYLLLFGVDGLWVSAKGFLWLFLPTFPLWIVGWLGAADVKLMGSVGAIVGGAKAAGVLLGVLVAGLVFALAVAVIRRELDVVIGRTYRAILFRSTAEIEGNDDGGKGRLPYALPISFGALGTLLYMYM